MWLSTISCNRSQCFLFYCMSLSSTTTTKLEIRYFMYQIPTTIFSDDIILSSFFLFLTRIEDTSLESNGWPILFAQLFKHLKILKLPCQNSNLKCTSDEWQTGSTCKILILLINYDIFIRSSQQLRIARLILYF